MKHRLLIRVVAISAFAVLSIPLEVTAQNVQPTTSQTHYAVIALPTLGGTASNGWVVNNRGWVAGDANLAGDQNEHAYLWHDGVMTDLTTDFGPNSAALGINNSGLVSGEAQSGIVDPLEEQWGAVFFCTGAANCLGTENLMRGFVWRDGVMTALPNLGGNNNGAFQVNNNGEIAGMAETANHDPSCAPPQALDYEAVVWDTKRDPIQIRVLPKYPGDSVAYAGALNDNGQVVGASGPCQYPNFGVFGLHILLWQGDTVINLGSLGGLMNNGPSFINNRGQVVGQSDLAGDTTAHAFLWENGVMKDLGTLPGDSSSLGQAITDSGLVMGVSFDANGNGRPFLWENGVMTDLNTLTPPNSGLYLTFCGSMNERREISCSAVDQNTQNYYPAVLAIPCDAGHAGDPRCKDAAQSAIGIERPKVALPENVRQQSQRRFGFPRR